MGSNASSLATSAYSSFFEYLVPESFTPDIQQFFQSQVDQIAEQLSDASVQLVYQSSKITNWLVIAGSTQICADIETAFLNTLESEEQWLESLAPLELNELPIQSNYWAYVCPMSCLEQVSCLLVGTQQSLAIAQQHTIATNIQLINEYLNLFYKYRKQKSTAQSLLQNFQHIEHQLRKPLALIEIYTEILSSQLQEREGRSQLNSIQSAVKEIGNYLKELTICHQSQSTQSYLCDLRTILAESLKGLQPWLLQKQLKTQYSLESAMLKVDAWQLKQVFDNLLDNAIQFSPENGTISCYWQVFHQEVLVEIWDEGSGLTEEDLKQVFNPFYSRRPGGTGLGLAIAQKIVLAHRGRLWVRNLPNGGAKFSFVLPR